MNMELIGKDLHPSDMLRGRIENKLGKIERRLGHKLFVRVKLDSETQRKYSCGIHFQGSGHDFTANGKGQDLIKATDDALHKIERQVSKFQHRDEGNRRHNTIDMVVDA